MEMYAAERMREITGASPRVAAIEQGELAPSATRSVRELAKFAGAGDSPVINSYLRTLAKHQSIFEASFSMGKALFTGELQPQDRELIILRVAWICGAPYQWGEHVKIAKRMGLTSQTIEKVVEGSSCTSLLERDRALLLGVEEILTNKMICDQTWLELSDLLSESELIEFVAVVGQYAATACLQNVLRVPLPRANAGLYAR